ncbi:MAG: class I SAM-dependent methyltransferase [Anaerolineae bacterium]
MDNIKAENLISEIGQFWEIVNCTLCGSESWIAHLTRGDLNLFLEGEFSLVRCSECGLVYLNPRPTRSQVSLLYPIYYDQFNFNIHKRRFWASLDHNYGLLKRCKSVLRYKDQGRLLDVGCATGDFLDAMRKRPGWEVYGVEISESASEYARRYLGLAVKTGDLEDVDYPEHYFDVVTLWHVLEHLYDPLNALKKIHLWLKPDGILIFNTPNLDSLDARLFGPYWIGYDLPRHLQIFSPNTLRILTDKSGFRIVDMRCLYGSYAAAASSIRFWIRAKKRNAKGLKLVERILFSLPLRILASPCFFLMDRLRLSSALTVTCVKAGD